MKVGVLLAGCGVYDGAEIHESTFALLALEQAGATYLCFAPDAEQLHVINHFSGEVSEGESRNVLVESARIARGAIRDVREADVNELDAILIPGGFGAAKNLCTFAVEGANCSVEPTVAQFLRDFQVTGKPMGFACIAPAVAAKVFGEGVELTIGTDVDTAVALEAMGAKHVNCAVDETHTDSSYNIVTAPAYMSATSISEVYASINALVRDLVTRIPAGV